ncbi:EAL domain-containing protein [Deinococcus sp. QL22]|uniref:EAL domain-containing protein n=1 Tax=Deinococcus sp. QL22 TaxID=2939437 RepID=UPI002016EB2E|nr:EAL domain-containing protein [Deinococcus sp. QL22]UQN09655.1 EAL domain-containing protein [Deinococcus sp. QL22]
MHAASSHVQRKLTLLLAAHDVPSCPEQGALLIAASAFDKLPLVLAAFLSNERSQVLAAPWDGEQLDPWGLAPLEHWVRRLESPWFHEASEKLLFHFQPIVQLGTGQVYGYEALVRAQWNGHFFGAGALLDAAAAHGQARAFDALARRNAIVQGYPQLGPDQLLFINFAPGVIYNPEVCLQTTYAACREVGADLSRLLFEVTESEAFPDLGLLKRILERYRAEGAQVALDDLGAGHTSLTYLAELKPDIVKLDRALISGVHDSDPRVPLVSALVHYAHELGIRVVAEGIETAQELQLVMELGTDLAQGYYLGRPVPQPTGLAPQAAGHWNLQ